MTSEPDKLKGAWAGSAQITPEPAAADTHVDDNELEYDPAVDEYMAEEWEAELKNIDIGPPVKPPPPPERLSVYSRRSKPRHALVALVVVVALTALVVFAAFQIPGLVRSKLESKLQAAGFPLTQVGPVSLTPASISAQNIKLDQYGFDEIKTLQANVNWPKFLTTGDVGGLSLSGVHLGRDSNNIGPDLRQMVGNLLLLPAYRISVSDVTVDITTDFGELRVTMDGSVTPDETGTQRLIKARIQSSQFQLGFDSTWDGTLSEDGSLDLSAEVADGRLNIGPMRISRYNGWISLAMKDTAYALSSQMEAGSATFMDVPLQNLSLVTAHESGTSNVIFRSGISGMPDIMFAGDMVRTDKEQSFNTILSGNNLGMFLDYIEEATGKTKEIRQQLVDFGNFRFTMDFESGKRFVGGPLPFAIALSSNGQQVMSGNILAYPDTLDVRGSLETSDALALAFQDYFKIPSENMRQNFIRLDGDMRRFFAFGEPPATATAP